VLLLLVLLFSSALTVSVSTELIECRFGPGLVRRRIHPGRVKAAQTVRNKWYYGWGIRLIPQGWLWNVAGLDAVEPTLIDGKRFRIGTDEPQTLLDAIYLVINKEPRLKAVLDPRLEG
jgi:hypothetical protein